MQSAVPERTTFLLLRKTPFQDTGFIVSGISPQFGRIDFLFRGARTIGKKKYPMIGLFREYSIAFRFPKTQDGQMVFLSSMELQAVHDGIANHMASYLRACKLAAFLLRNIPQMCEIPIIWNAFSAALIRWESVAIPPELTSALFWMIYAREQGIFPPDIIANDTMEQLLSACALNPQMQIPAEIPASVSERLCLWADKMESI